MPRNKLDYATSDVERVCFSGVTTGRRDPHVDTQREGTGTEAKPKERRNFLTHFPDCITTVIKLN